MPPIIGDQNLKVCKYGENCYRKNPNHFREYSHPHLNKIFAKGRDPVTNQYVIPDEFFMSTEVIEEQLEVFETIFPKPSKNEAAEVSASTTTKTTIALTNSITTTTSPITKTKAKATTSLSSSHAKKPATTTSTALGSSKDSQISFQGYRLGKSSEQSTTVSAVKKPTIEKTGALPTTSSTSVVGNASSDADGVQIESSCLAKKQKITRDILNYIPVVIGKGFMAEKLAKSAPYNFFLTAVTDCKYTHHEPLTVTFQEILDKSLGEIESSVQINFMVDIGWLLGHYYFSEIIHTPLLVIYGDDMPELRNISQHQPQVTAIKVNMPTPFATSHTKMMLFGYKDGSMRIVISTANLYEDDWHNRTQGVWISPKLPPLPEDADTAYGDSRTSFRQDLLLYLAEYKIAQLQPWIARIRQTDFSEINVFLIASVPGGHREGGIRGHPWGHARLGTLLQKHSAAIDDKIPIVCQSSSIGSLGPNIQSWVQHDFVNSLRKDSQVFGARQFPLFKMIYPSFGNVSNSHDGLIGGGCLPYNKSTHDKQAWLKSYLHLWKSRGRCRTQAMPHIKSYARFNAKEQSLYWFVLTSANLSKAAWGAFNKNTNIQPCLRIYNYEAGVLFLPKFVTGEDSFPLAYRRNNLPAFPLPYDVPLTPYGPDDAPFFMDYLR